MVTCNLLYFWTSRFETHIWETWPGEEERTHPTVQPRLTTFLSKLSPGLLLVFCCSSREEERRSRRRNMEKISWTAKVSNSEVLNWVKENRCIISTINQRKRRWLGHVLLHDVLLRDVLEGRMTGKRTRGRKRLQLMSNICEGYETAKKRAEDRCLWCVSVMGVIDLLLQQNTRRSPGDSLGRNVVSLGWTVGCVVQGLVRRSLPVRWSAMQTCTPLHFSTFFTIHSAISSKLHQCSYVYLLISPYVR